mmetsp:Transcript_16074/g.24382  ORF Transcript_16074/g.24382 Transcript_16074/m.24382 type:complete len:444 (-) Transcript_16074:61-1392(-)
MKEWLHTLVPYFSCSQSRHVRRFVPVLILGLGPQCGIGLQPDSIDPDKSSRITGVVIEVISPTLNIHTRQVRIVQSIRRRPSTSNNITLVKLQTDHSCHVPLRVCNGVPHHVHLRCEPESVVAQSRELIRHMLGDTLDLPVHANSLEVHVCVAEESSAGGFVNTARFDANESVFDDVDTADSVGSSDFVCVHEEFEGVGLDSSIGLIRQLNGDTLHELNVNLGTRLRSSLGTDRHLKHALLVRAVRILKHTTLVTGVEQVLINRIVRLRLGIHGNTVFCAVRQQILTPLERFDELRITPRSDGLHPRIKRLRTHLKPNLIISLSGSTVSHVLRPLLFSDAHHLFGNAGTGHGCSEQVLSFVDGIALNGFEDVVFDEVLAKVGDNAFEGTAGDGLRLDGFEVLVVLADIGAKGDDVETLFAEPLEDDRRVKSAGVGEDYLGLSG